MPFATGKLHRALRLSVEHIPDVGLEDIEEEEEHEIEEEIESQSEYDEEDAPKEMRLNQDGMASDETDMESLSKSHKCLHKCITFFASFVCCFCLQMFVKVMRDDV